MGSKFGSLRGVGVYLAGAVLALGATSVARAQSGPAAAPRGVLIEPVVAGDGGAIAASMQRILRTRIEALGVAQLDATPALGLSDLGLAVGCVGRSAQCFDGIAAQLQVEVLVWLELERSGQVVALALRSYTRGEEDIREASRRFEGADADAEALDEIDGLVRQLFGLPPPSPDEVAEGDEAHDAPPARPAPRTAERDDGLAIGLPVGLLGAGVLTLGAGFIVGAVSQSSNDEYARVTVTSPADVDRALSIHDRAATEATVANVLFVGSGVLLAAGITALIIGLAMDGGEEEPAVALAPVLGPTTLGLSAFGRFGGAR
ncbi:MAG: hypothetical protein AB7S26_36470 [Sandaracinaceae bacterium]